MKKLDITYMKKLFCIVLIITSLFLQTITVAAVEDRNDSVTGVVAEGYCVIDSETGEIVVGKNINKQYRPASITKIMTALVAIEHCDNLNDIVTFSPTAVNVSSNSTTLNPIAKAGEQMTVKDVLYGMFLPSGNECANAIAEYTAGSVENFAALMNERAAQIGAVNTHFVNPHGLDNSEHYTTPYDMAIIFKEALNNSIFLQIASTRYYTIPATNITPARSLEMGHSMVRGAIKFPGTYAGKTGRTKLAGRTLATAARRGGTGLISIIMLSTENNFYLDTEMLLEYAFGLKNGTASEMKWEATDDSNNVAWTTNQVKLRTCPSIYTQTGELIPYGTKVTVDATYDNWRKISYNGKVYYITSYYLSDIEPPAMSQEQLDRLKLLDEDVLVKNDSTVEETAEEELESTDGQSKEEKNTVQKNKQKEAKAKRNRNWKIVIYILLGVIFALGIFLVYSALREGKRAKKSSDSEKTKKSAGKKMRTKKKKRSSKIEVEIHSK